MCDIQWEPEQASIDTGIIASICCNPDHSTMLAAGSYLGDTGIFDENTGDLLYVLQGQRGGITQVTATGMHAFPRSPQGIDSHHEAHSLCCTGGLRRKLWHQSAPLRCATMCRWTSQKMETTCTRVLGGTQTSSAGTSATHLTWCTGCREMLQTPTSASNLT